MFIDCDHHIQKVFTDPGFHLDAAWFLKGQSLEYRKVENTYMYIAR